MDKGTRKQIYDLTLEDLAGFPVWEFALDEERDEGQDEATVRPLTGQLNLDELPGAIVRAKFTLADGTLTLGHMTVPGVGGYSLQDLHPSIVTATGHVDFLFGYTEPSAEEKNEIYLRLRKSAKQVFPIDVCSDVPGLDPALTGVIPGFLFLKKRLLRGQEIMISQ